MTPAEIQRALIGHGYPLPRFGADGKIGPETLNALSAFGHDHGIAAPGLASGRPVWRPEEWAQILAALQTELVMPTTAGAFSLPVDERYFKLPKPGTVLDFGYDRGLRAGTTQHHHHQGIDMVAPVGTGLYAIADGVVTHAWGGAGPLRGFSGYGRLVVVHMPGLAFSLASQPPKVDVALHDHGHGDDLYMMHAHCDTVLVGPGDVVLRGQLLATVGRTAFRTADPKHLCGAHVHHELALLGYPKGLDRKVADYGRIHPSRFYLDNGAA